MRCIHNYANLYSIDEPIEAVLSVFQQGDVSSALVVKTEDSVLSPENRSGFYPKLFINVKSAFERKKTIIQNQGQVL